MINLFSLNEHYWDEFILNEEDIEFIYNHLLDKETPLAPQDLIQVIIEDRLRREKQAVERQRSQDGKIYAPKEIYEIGAKLVFPALNWQLGQVTNSRSSHSFSNQPFKVIEVEFADGDKREFASGLEDHILNQPPVIDDQDPLLNPQSVFGNHGEALADSLTVNLSDNPDFVYIAGRWFPRALLFDVNIGNLNLAEAVLDMAGGGPLPTSDIISQVELPEGINPHLAEFSLDLAMQEDSRFDEVGPVGEVVWYLQRLEPESVRETPLFLKYQPIEYDRTLLTEGMLALEKRLNDELSPLEGSVDGEEIQLELIYPHWRAGTLPLSLPLIKVFPTALESPRVRFNLVDGDSGEKIPAWVVRLENYVFGLRDWYMNNGILPGSYVRIKPGKDPGEVIIQADSHRSTKEWVRTALIGVDGGVVYMTNQQIISTNFDPRMIVAVPEDVSALDSAWEQREKARPPFEQIIVETFRKLTILNPQSHVHARELYSAVNVEMRCPPGPIFALLASRPWFIHVGDLHFRFDDSEGD
jgi:hypothetical protein